ncbi:MAG: 4Fe-4S binding protein [Promethearchaeota archaeon]
MPPDINDNEDEYIFYSPVMVNVDHCGGCKACKHACPAHAIEIEVTGAVVDREACLGIVREQGGDCFDCVLACRYNVISLKKFLRTKEGRFIQID